jgi:hypothetical protein
MRHRQFMGWMGFLVALPACSSAVTTAGEDNAVASSQLAESLDADRTHPTHGYSSPVYSQDANWLCKPGLGADVCGHPADATEIGPNNELLPIEPVRAKKPKLDCFYVYPTVDLSNGAELVTAYEPLDAIVGITKQQAAVLSNVCTLYVPFYHQAKAGAYRDPTKRDGLLEQVYLEVEDAFKHYMGQYNKGNREIVLIGHSQGSHMLRRLLQRHFDGPDNAKLRKQLSAAIMIGALGDVLVPQGQLVGATFQDIPLCTERGQRACVITYNSYPANMPPGDSYGIVVGGIPDGMDPACTNPGALGGGKVMSEGTYFESRPTGVIVGTLKDVLADTLGVTTYFSVFRDFYAMECKRNAKGLSYLSISVEPAPGDQRQDPIEYGTPSVAVLGTHPLDYAYVVEDLIDLLHKHAK